MDGSTITTRSRSSQRDGVRTRSSSRSPTKREPEKEGKRPSRNSSRNASPSKASGSSNGSRGSSKSLKENNPLLDRMLDDESDSDIVFEDDDEENDSEDAEDDSEEQSDSNEEEEKEVEETEIVSNGKRKKKVEEKPEEKKNGKGKSKKKTTKTRKKGKRKKANQRRNIKKIKDDTLLDSSVLAARKEEEERIQRQKQALLELKKTTTTLNNFEEITIDDSDEDNPMKARKELIDLIDSDDESKEVKPPPLPKFDDDEEIDDQNNCGLWTDDSLNKPDQEGKILINVGHPNDEKPIYLADQLAYRILPHQIGGIRFLWANIVESRKKYESSPGVGCILAHSMGLGKTLQAIAFVDIFLKNTTGKKVLIIVPVNTMRNWISEFDMWIPAQPTIDKMFKKEEVNCRTYDLFTMTDTTKTMEARLTEVRNWNSKGGVLIMGYEMYRILTMAPGKKKGKTDLSEVDQKDLEMALVDPGPDLVICDEGHRIKNCKSSTSIALKSIRTKRRIVMTGYPLQNNLMEYYCMVDFVRPNYLGSDRDFSNMFERPIKNGQLQDSFPADKQKSRFRTHVLSRLLRGFVQRRSQTILKKSLPDKIEYVFMLRMTDIQKKLFEALYQYLRESATKSSFSLDYDPQQPTESILSSPIIFFSLCNKIWNHPDILYMAYKKQTVLDVNEDLELGSNSTKKKSSANSLTYDWAAKVFEDYQDGILENSTKMLLLMEMIDFIVGNGEKVLVFSQSLFTLNLIEEFLSTKFLPRSTRREKREKWEKMTNYFRLDGSTPTSDRDDYIKKFNDPKNSSYRLFLLSTKAGSLGVNLIGANRIIVFDASWNPCHDAQAACRIYRYGQTKACSIYRLIADNTLELKIYNRQVDKQGTAGTVVDELPIEVVINKDDIASLIHGLTIEDQAYQEKNPDFDKSCNEPLVRYILNTHKNILTREPFEHESLLLEAKDKKLTKEEQDYALRQYKIEKNQLENRSRGIWSGSGSSYGNGHPYSNGFLSTGFNPFSPFGTYNGPTYNGPGPSRLPSSIPLIHLPSTSTGFPHVSELNQLHIGKVNPKWFEMKTRLMDQKFYHLRDFILQSELKLKALDGSTSVESFTIVPAGEKVSIYQHAVDGREVMLTPDGKVISMAKTTQTQQPSTSTQTRPTSVQNHSSSSNPQEVDLTQDEDD